MILMLLLTAIVIGPLAFIVTWRWSRTRRVLVAVVAVALFWIAEIGFLIMIQDHLSSAVGLLTR